MPLAELLEACAKGRAYYAELNGAPHEEALQHEAGAFHSAAKIARGDRSRVWAIMPTHMMTAAMEAAPADELADAYEALPESVQGDAAPEGATLADRIRAIVQERDHSRNTADASRRRYVQARDDDSRDLSRALGVEPGSLEWHRLIERVTALREQQAPGRRCRCESIPGLDDMPIATPAPGHWCPVHNPGATALEVSPCAQPAAHPAHDYPTTDPEWVGPPLWRCPGVGR